MDLPACRKYIHVYKALDICLPPRLKFQDRQRGIPSSEPRGPLDPYLCPAQGENLSRTLSQIAAFLWDPGMQTLLATEGVDPAATNTQCQKRIKARGTAQPLEAAERERRWWLPGFPRRTPAGPSVLATNTPSNNWAFPTPGWGTLDQPGHWSW